MRAWTSPDLPRLPGAGDALRLHDTSSGSTKVAARAPDATMYVCGITPYDATHLGHAATYLAFDLVNRYWRDAGLQVTYVQNVTDIDDPLLERADATGVNWLQLAEEQTQLFREDMAWLRILAPEHFVGAVEFIPQIVELIQALEPTGAMYDVDGDRYFDVSADQTFGSVSGMGRAEMVGLSAERGGDPQRPGKRDALDPLLWKAAAEGEPWWQSPLGPGRPGWHVECSAIALSHLGAGFDVQAGGDDLVFPHHEMSASHAHVATGKPPFAQSYVHAGMIGLDGQKMSKSQGNLVLASSLREQGEDPRVVRLALMAGHYRAYREWNQELLDASRQRLRRWERAAAAGHRNGDASVVAHVRARLADDLDTLGVLEVLDRWAEDTLSAAGTGTAQEDVEPGVVVQAVDALLGIDLR
ncbi:MAG TPA: cysteine--1-D-myo-inosityl 2-amino-2-deoxy-alpha-D-glucopyranoside ligase [Jiangellaceae bacterium]|nr:cysteine--1-D-myo-inosityl 2-amino-2-deoxy-alpha-D-glucopyranoside ligase [Jiangellaceae bacterium]